MPRIYAALFIYVLFIDFFGDGLHDLC